MQQPEPAIADPAPPQELASEDQQQGDNDEHHKGDVEVENEVGGE